MTDRPIEEVYIEAIRARVNEREYTLERVAQLVDLSERQVRRILKGQCRSMDTLHRFAVVLGLRVEARVWAEYRSDNECPTVCQNQTQLGNTGQVRPNQDISDNERPVAGWSQAAMFLGISERQLHRDRHRYGSRLRRAWWESPSACRAWYRVLVAGPRLTEDPTPPMGEETGGGE